MGKYELKYKKALKWMQSLYSGLHGATKEEAEKYFPELKDSEDERIVKCLLNYFNHVRYNGLDLKGTDADKVIAWLVANICDFEYYVTRFKKDFGL